MSRKITRHSTLTALSSHHSHVNRPRRKLLASAISALIAGTMAPTWAEDTRVLEEVIVTATKRSESVMDVPLAITAISGDFIRDAGLDDVKDLIAFTPGITGNSKDSFLDFVSVRGIRTIDYGNGGDPSVSIFKNGLYQGRTGSAVTSLYDIERAEVLRGPQGFMFGRNSVSGAINVHTVKASSDEQSGYIDLDIGERDHRVVEGAYNIPINDNLAIRLSGYFSEEDGYVENLQGGPDLISHEKSGFRFSTHYEAENLNIDFFAEYEDRDQAGTIYRATGRGGAFNDLITALNGGVPVAFSSDERTVNIDDSIGNTDGGDIFAWGIQIDYDLGFATFTSLTGYKDHTYAYVEDYDATPLVIFNYGQEQEGDYWEQEFRLTSNSDGPLSWYVGASYYKEDLDTEYLGQQAEDVYCGTYLTSNYNPEYAYAPGATCLEIYGPDSEYFTPSPDGLINDRHQTVGKFTGYSTYVEVKYEINESFDMVFGVRYSYDEKEFSIESLPTASQFAGGVQAPQTPVGGLKDKTDWDDTTYRIVANWHPTDSSLVFASITTGYKPGGYGSFSLNRAQDAPNDFDPETVTSYDIGYKGTLADGLVQLSVNAFIYDYEDLQANYNEGPITITDNIGQLDGMGVEAEVYASLSQNFTLRLGMSWFDSEANDVQELCGNGEFLTGDVNVCEGNSIPYAPEWTAFAVLNGEFPVSNGGEIFATISWTWEDDTRADWARESIVDQTLRGINQTDLVLGYRQGDWAISAYVENVMDKNWVDGTYSQVEPATPYAELAFGPSRPRTAGMKFNYSF